VANASLFEIACEALEQASGLDRLAARGTLRLALKEAGLETATLTTVQLAVVIQRVLPRELRARGIANPEKACEEMSTRVASAGSAAGPAAAAPEDLFRRLRSA
jgi:hypothetical protein